MPVEVIMPKVDMDMSSGTIASWHIKEGEQIEKGAPLFDIETDKATMEVESPTTGTLHYITANSGDEIEIGKCIGWLFEAGEAIETPAPVSAPTHTEVAPAPASEPKTQDAAEMTITQQPNQDTGGKVRATPLARRMAKTQGIDLSTIQGSGPRGRITKSDILSHEIMPHPPTHQDTPTAESATEPTTGPIASKAQLDALGVEYEAIPVERMRQTIAERLTQSKSTIPHFYLEMDCQLDALIDFRSRANEALATVGSSKLSINDMLVRACAQALTMVPQANASWAGDEIIRYKHANISVAVSIEGGLITPVVRQAQNKSLVKISQEIADLAERAKSGKLKTHEYQGGSFSISNLGMYGVKSFSAILNPPESMILAVGQAQRRFIEDDDGNPIGATILSVTLSCDHRVVDGALGAQWLSQFKRCVENPILLTLDLE